MSRVRAFIGRLVVWAVVAIALLVALRIFAWWVTIPGPDCETQLEVGYGGAYEECVGP